MGTIHKQLVTDEEGRPVGVLIPYEEWLRIEQQLGGAAGANGVEQLRRHEGSIRLSCFSKLDASIVPPEAAPAPMMV